MTEATQLGLSLGDLLEESTEEQKSDNTAWEKSEEDGFNIPLTEDAIQEGINNYYNSLLENTTEEDIQNIIKYVDNYSELCDEFESKINHAFETLPEVTSEEIKGYRFPVDDERSKNFFEKVNPVLSFLVQNEKIDKSVLDKAHDSFKRGYISSLKATSLYAFEPMQEAQISQELSNAVEQSSYQLLSFQLENSLRVLVLHRRSNSLTKEFLDLVRSQANKVIDVTESFLKFNQLHTDAIDENRKVINDLFDLFENYIIPEETKTENS